jgi:hypothetical protein
LRSLATVLAAVCGIFLEDRRKTVADPFQGHGEAVLARRSVA